MTLLISVLAAVVSTIIWYTSKSARKLRVIVLCYLFWGSSLMWLIDAITEYIELGADYFTPAIEDMINDSFLGLSVVALGLVIWTVYVLIKDPLDVIKNRNKLDE